MISSRKPYLVLVVLEVKSEYFQYSLHIRVDTISVLARFEDESLLVVWCLTSSISKRKVCVDTSLQTSDCCYRRPLGLGTTTENDTS